MFKTQVLKLYRKAFGPWVTAAPPRPRVRPTFKPRLEPLEDRIAPATFTVANTNDAGAGSLRTAILDLNNSTDASNTINVAAGVTGTIALQSPLSVILKNVNLTGPGANDLTVTRDPQAAAAFGIFRTSPNTTVSITGLTISGGNPAGNGGGIYNAGTLTLTSDDISENSAGNLGGGIYNSTTGSVTLSSAALVLNSATVNGGGIYNAGTVNITNSDLFGNNATVNGGASPKAVAPR